jgi:hypothetical protein
MTYLPARAGYSDLGYEPPTSDLIDPSNFNDTKFPGSVYATNKETHAKFVELQKQLNRGAAAKKISTRIATDGKLGSETLALAGQVSVNTYAVSSLRNLAQNAVIVALAAKAKADAAGVPRTLSAPTPTSPPAILNTATLSLEPVPAASALDAFKNMSPMMMLLVGAAAVAVGYYVTKKKGRK